MQLQVLPKASRKLSPCCIAYVDCLCGVVTIRWRRLQADVYDMRRAWHLTAEDSQAVMMPYQPTCCTCNAELLASTPLALPLLRSCLALSNGPCTLGRRARDHPSRVAQLHDLHGRGQDPTEPSGDRSRTGQHSQSVAARLDFRPATPRQQYSPATESRRGQANGFGGRHAGGLASGAETPPDLRRLSSSDNPQQPGDGSAAQKSYSLRCGCSPSRSRAVVLGVAHTDVRRGAHAICA